MNDVYVQLNAIFNWQERKNPRPAKSDTTSERPRKVNYDLVNKLESDEGDQLLRIAKSSPALKKGSPTRKRSVGKILTF